MSSLEIALESRSGCPKVIVERFVCKIQVKSGESHGLVGFPNREDAEVDVPANEMAGLG